MIKINKEKKRLSLDIQVRQRRDELLAKSDWRSLPDAPGDRDAWLNYRQKLRDITELEGFPFDFNWPFPPNE